MTTETRGLSATQIAVQIVQNMIQCGMDGARYTEQMENLHGLMAEFAIGEIRKDFAQVATYTNVHEAIAYVTNEDNENTPMAEAYWAATSLFFRKVYQAAAAAA